MKRGDDRLCECVGVRMLWFEPPVLSQDVFVQGAALDSTLPSAQRTSGLDVERLRDRVYRGVIGLGLIATLLWMSGLVYIAGHLIGWW